jgi:hypothetical protein
LDNCRTCYIPTIIKDKESDESGTSYHKVSPNFEDFPGGGLKLCLLISASRVVIFLIYMKNCLLLLYLNNIAVGELSTIIRSPVKESSIDFEVL